jgi:hypothetical protein
MSKIKLNFIPNNFTFDKTCKVIMHDDAQKKKNKQFLKRGFFQAVTDIKRVLSKIQK